MALCDKATSFGPCGHITRETYTIEKHRAGPWVTCEGSKASASALPCSQAMGSCVGRRHAWPKAEVVTQGKHCPSLPVFHEHRKRLFACFRSCSVILFAPE
jgi:hypothetical protein